MLLTVAFPLVSGAQHIYRFSFSASCDGARLLMMATGEYFITAQFEERADFLRRVNIHTPSISGLSRAV